MFIIIGIGINLVKNPKIKSYPTTNLFDLIHKSINKRVIENKLKQIFEKDLLKMYKLNR